MDSNQASLPVRVSQDDFFLGKCFEAMEVDSLSSSHPISTPVENPAQIQEMFDDVSYDKVGLPLLCSLITMTEPNRAPPCLNPLSPIHSMQIQNTDFHIRSIQVSHFLLHSC